MFVESVWGLAMALSTCARRCASAGLKLARAMSAAPGTAGGGGGVGFVANRPQVVAGGGRIGGMAMAMECWRSPMMVQVQLMSCCAKVDNPPPREVSFRFFLQCVKTAQNLSGFVRLWRMSPRGPRVRLLSRFPLGLTYVRTGSP